MAEVLTWKTGRKQRYTLSYSQNPGVSWFSVAYLLSLQYFAEHIAFGQLDPVCVQVFSKDLNTYSVKLYEFRVIVAGNVITNVLRVPSVQ